MRQRGKKVGGHLDRGAIGQLFERQTPQHGHAALAPVVERLRLEREPFGNDPRPHGVNQIAVLMHGRNLHSPLIPRKPYSFMAGAARVGVSTADMGTGERIRQRLAELGISQAQLARTVRESPQRIGNYVQGTREPDDVVLAKIALALDTSADELAGRAAQREAAIRKVLGRLLEIEGMADARARVIVEATIEGLRLHASLEGDATEPQRSQMAAQLAWQSQFRPERAQ